MNNSKQGLFMLILIIICSGVACNKTQEVQKYFKFIENPSNGFIKKLNEKDIHYEMFYKPLNYVSIMELRKINITSNELDSVKKLFQNSIAFTLTLSCDSCNLNNTQDSTSNVTAYLDFDIKNDLKLVYGKDTMPCQLSYHERPAGGSTKHKIVLAFDKTDDPTKGFQIIYYDNLFHNGIKTFRFNAEDLKSEPVLNL